MFAIDSRSWSRLAETRRLERIEKERVRATIKAQAPSDLDREAPVICPAFASRSYLTMVPLI